MKPYDYLIIGGGVAGVTAAETIREHDGASSIGIVSDDVHPLYSRVLLPSFLKHRVSRDELFLRTIDDFGRKKIDLRLSEEVSSIDAHGKSVRLANGFTLGFRSLIIATGGRPKAPPFQGQIGNLYRLHTIEDADRMYEAVVEREIRHPVVVGASFIGLEFLEIFAANKISPTLIIKGSHFFDRFLDTEGGALLLENFRRYGITVFSNEEVGEIQKKGLTHFEVQTSGLRTIECDSIAVGIGIERTIGFLHSSGIEAGENGIRANEFLETNVPGIFVAGDVAEYFDGIAGRHRAVGNWTSSVLQGQRAALNAMGMREKYHHVPSYSISNLRFQITIVGDVDDATDAITRFDGVHRKYARYFLRNGAFAGAALINNFSDKVHIVSLIERGISAEQFRANLQDPHFDIHTISAV